MKIIVDRERCEAHGACAGVDENLFPLDDDGYSAVDADYQVSAGQEIVARSGVGACPMVALRIED